MSRTPAHAGRLRPSEQFVFAAVFALMAGFVVVITMSAVRSPLPLLGGGGTTAAGSQTVPAGTERQTATSASTAATIQPVSPRLNARLAAAMRTVLSAHPGQLAVGVIDETTGQQARYEPTAHFSSGGIITADILTAVLVRRSQAGMPVTPQQATMASTMMATGGGPAAASMWRAIGGGNGLASANRLLKLKYTIPGAGNQWGQTKTTVADQLQLLIDLTSAPSPLTASARAYALRLLDAHGTPRWGVSAAGAGSAVHGALLQDGQVWVANSMGIVRRAGHVLLVVILSASNSSQTAGISLASAAAVAAANVLTRPGS